jgi:hypothetical protein
VPVSAYDTRRPTVEFMNNMLLVTSVFYTHSKLLFKRIITISFIWLQTVLQFYLGFIWLASIKWTRTASVAGTLRNHSLVPSKGQVLISYARCPDWFWGPLSLLNGYSVDPSSSTRRTGHEGDYSHLPTNEVKNEWICTCINVPSTLWRVRGYAAIEVLPHILNCCHAAGIF